MPITVYLEIAIGVVFVWIMLSMGVSALLEWFAGIRKWRANDLEAAIKNLLEKADKDDSANSLASELYSHPLIESLSSKVGGLPSYIPKKTFGLALFDILMTAGTEESVFKVWGEELDNLESKGAKQAIMENVLNELARFAKSNISEQSKDRLMRRLFAEAEKIQAKLLAKYPDSYYDTALKYFLSEEMLEEFADELLSKSDYGMLTEGVARFAVNSPTLMGTIDGLLVDAQGYLEKGEIAIKEFRTSLETWFNDSMDRLGGYYKRRAQLFSFLFGLGLAITLNIDSVAVVRTLWLESTTRSALVAEAQSLESLPEEDGSVRDTVDRIDTKLEELTLPVGWTKLDEATRQAVDNDPEKWHVNGFVAAETYPAGMPFTAFFFLEKVVGFALSGAAAAQGAPFWFEVLKKMVNVRSSGKKPDEEE